MAIYKSSFNQKPEKEKKVKQPKPEKEKPVKPERQTTKIHLNGAIVALCIYVGIGLLCILPNIVKHVMLGLFGLSVYPICLLGIFFSVVRLTKREFTIKKRYLAYLISAVCIIWFIFHLIMTNALSIDARALSYGSYLAKCYQAQVTAGGLVFGLLSYPIVKLITIVGAYVFSAIALAVMVGLIIDYVYVDKTVGHDTKQKFDFKEIEAFDAQPEPKKVEKQVEEKYNAKKRLGLDKRSSTTLTSDMPQRVVEKPRTSSRPMSKREYILTPIEPIIPKDTEIDDIFLDKDTGMYNSKKVDKPRKSNIEEIGGNVQSKIDLYEDKEESVNTIDIPNEQPSQYNDIILEDETENYDDFIELASKSTMVADEPKPQPTYIQQPAVQETKQETYANQTYQQATLLDNDESIEEQVEPVMEDTSEQVVDNNNHSDEYFEEEVEEAKDTNYVPVEEVLTEEIENLENIDEPEDAQPTNENNNALDEYSSKKDMSLGNTNNNDVVLPSVVDISKFNLPNKINKSLEPEQIKIDTINKPKQKIPAYNPPKVGLLEVMEKKESISYEKVQENVKNLEQVLEDFKVPAKVVNVQVGPAVTRYELSMPRGISVNKIVGMADDIAMTLRSNGSIRVEAPIPGKSAVGIEVPNDSVTPVSLREVIDSKEFKERGNPLSFVLGKDINGDIIFCNLDKMPHLLVAGSTGSGKSVCLNTMLLSMCYKAGPQDVRLILVDPKMVEFSTYNGLPHLLVPEVITGKEQTINAFDWAIKEMERRYALFAKNHVVNINEYNKLDMVKSGKEDKLPFIVIVVDELADLMLEAKRELEDRIAKIAAKSRAAGIHLVLATQRPSVDVITGVIKNNLPSRIAFALTSYIDSKTILDGSGAEKLLGKGDMLFKMQDKPDPRRVQGAFVSSSEINAVVDYIKQHNKPVYDEMTNLAITNPHQAGAVSNNGGGLKEQEFDPILKDVLRMFIETKQASSSIIQRRYSVGFNRAGRIMEQMERAGFVSPPNGSKPRQVLISMEEYNIIFAEE